MVDTVELRATQGLLYHAVREGSVVEAGSLEGHNSVSRYSTMSGTGGKSFEEELDVVESVLEYTHTMFV